MVCKNTNIKVTVLIDMRTTDLTLYECLARIDQYKATPMYKDSEFYLDGEKMAVCAKAIA